MNTGIFKVASIFELKNYFITMETFITSIHLYDSKSFHTIHLVCEEATSQSITSNAVVIRNYAVENAN